MPLRLFFFGLLPHGHIDVIGKQNLMSSEPSSSIRVENFFSDSNDGPRPQLDRYDFRRKLGEGRFGEVWLAMDKVLERPVAIKLAHPVHLPASSDTRILISEAKSLAAMDHPNIIVVYELGETSEGRFYIVSRFVDGSDLSQILKRGIQDLEFTLDVIATIAEALDSAHKKGFIHRDIKPANILIEDATQSPCLADFGLALKDTELLSNSQLAGTPLYMSPEQARATGVRLDGRSDVFSLGCVLYQMATGVHPFSGATTGDILHAIVHASPVSPRSINAAVPEDLEQICLKALQKDPSDRFNTAGEMADALRRLIELRKSMVSEEPQSIGPYLLLQRIGEGGMGIVYAAEQMQPVRRRVALKVIRRGINSEEAKLRFQTERQALAVLNHVNIANVYESGVTDDKRLYFTMELIDGLSITEFCERGHTNLKEKLGLFLQVCEAIQHAHQKGIVHRDIKPSNVLVKMDSVAPLVKVIDFGLAKTLQPIGRLTEKELVTEYGKELGTYEYMSPEQTGLNAVDIDTRSDVYSLGVLLYELLTGGRPFERESSDRMAIDNLLLAIREREPDRPSQRLTGRKDTQHLIMGEIYRADLDWIVMKAIEKDRNRRYESAAQFADDVRRYLNQEPVTARPPSIVYLMRKAAKRHRFAIGITSLIAASLVLGIFGTSWQMIKARTAEKNADFQRDQAIAARNETEASLAITNFLLAISRWDEGRTQEAFELLYKVPVDLRNFEWYLTRHSMDAGHQTLYGHTEVVNSVRFHTDSNRIISGSNDGHVRLWDRVTLKELYSFRGHDGWVNAVAFSPDGQFVASAGADGTIRLMDAVSLSELKAFTADQFAVNCIAFNNDGETIASGNEDGVIRLWSVSTGEEILSMKGHSAAVKSLLFRPGHNQFVSGGEDATIKLWNMDSKDPAGEFVGHESWVLSVSFSADGDRLASGSADYTVRLWEVAGFKEITKFDDGTDWIGAVALSPDGKHIASAGWNQPIRIWNLETGVKRRLSGHRSHTVHCLDFSSDGSQLLSGSSDATIKIWDLASEFVDGIVGDHLGDIESLSYQATGDSFVSVGSDNVIRQWDSVSRSQIAETQSDDSRILSVAIDVKGANIISGHEDGTIIQWESRSGRKVRSWKGHDGAVHSVSFTLDDKRLATAGDDSVVKIWDTGSIQELQVLRGHSGPVRSISISSDGRSLASGSNDETVRLWDMTSGQQRELFKHHTGSVHSVYLSPDGSQLASAGVDGVVLLWNLDTEGEASPEMFLGHKRGADCVALAPDGKRIVASGSDGTVRIWDIETRAELRKFQVAADWVKQLAFHPNGNQLVIGDYDGQIRVWDAPRKNEMQVLAGDDVPLSGATFSTDGRTLYCRDDVGQVIGWKYFQDKWSRDPEIREIPESVTPEVNRSPDGRWLAIPLENTVTLVDLNFRAEVLAKEKSGKVGQPAEN